MLADNLFQSLPVETADEVFEELLRRLPDVELDEDAPVKLRPSNFIVGLESMPVRFTQAP